MALNTALKAGRRETLPVRAPILRDGFGEGPAGIAILFEIDSDLGLALWSLHRLAHAAVLDGEVEDPLVRDPVLSRAGDDVPGSGAERRSAQMRPRADPALWNAVRRSAPGLAGSLSVFDGWRSHRPTVSRADVAAACEGVATWATGEGYSRTASLFAEAAAHLVPKNSAAANAAARACRDAVLYARSEHWYLRARTLAREHRSETEMIVSLLGLGGLMHHLGHHAAARGYLLDAKRRAERRNRRREAAKASHDLLLFAAEDGDYGSGEFHAAEALRLYPLSNPRIPFLVHDWAFFLTRMHIYRPALPLLRAVLERVSLRQDRAHVWSTIARAAGGAGHVALHHEAAEHVLSEMPHGSANAGYAYHNLALGAWSAGAWDEAHRFATLTIDVARARGEQGVLLRATELRSNVARRTPAPGEAEPPTGNLIDALHRRCLSGLRRWKPRGARSAGPV